MALILLSPSLSLAEELTRPATRPLTYAKGNGELAAGYQNTGGDFAYNLDGSKITGRNLLPFRSYRDQSAVLSGAYGLTDGWELSFRIPYTWRKVNLLREPLIDTEGRLITFYPASKTSGLGDAEFGTTIAFKKWLAGRMQWKSASGSDNFFPTRMPDSRPAQYLGSGQSDLAFSVIADRKRGPARFAAEAGYRLRLRGISNYLLRDFNPEDELFVNGRALLQASPYWGLGLGFAYMHQATPSSVSVLRGFIPIWFALGDFELRAAGALPVYGKDYPALFPEQLADRTPLLGPSFEALFVYRPAPKKEGAR